MSRLAQRAGQRASLPGICENSPAHHGWATAGIAGERCVRVEGHQGAICRRRPGAGRTPSASAEP